jgi:2-(1,2-epoxy-1,2-dihydrophenyl)acetyl-CoA isomerase
MSAVLVADDAAVRVVTIDRPDKLNSLDRETRAELLTALESAASDDSVRALVLTGNGRAFCTGQDVGALDELVDAGATVRDTYNPLARALRSLPKPVVAAINGPAVGAGLGLALCCDLRVMARSTFLSCIFSQVALVPDTGTSAALVRALGHAHAYEAAVTGRRIGAEEALAARLVNEVADDDVVQSRSLELAHALADGPALAYRLTKQLFVAAAERSEDEMLELEAEYQGLAARDPAHAEAIAAFLGERSGP